MEKSVCLTPCEFSDRRGCRLDDVEEVVSRQSGRLHRRLARDEPDVSPGQLGDLLGVIGIRSNEFDTGRVDDDRDGIHLDGVVVEDALGVSYRCSLNVVCSIGHVKDGLHDDCIGRRWVSGSPAVDSAPANRPARCRSDRLEARETDEQDRQRGEDASALTDIDGGVIRRTPPAPTNRRRRPPGVTESNEVVSDRRRFALRASSPNPDSESDWGYWHGCHLVLWSSARAYTDSEPKSVTQRYHNERPTDLHGAPVTAERPERGRHTTGLDHASIVGSSAEDTVAFSRDVLA